MAAAKHKKPQRNRRFSSLADEYELALLQLERRGQQDAQAAGRPGSRDQDATHNPSASCGTNGSHVSRPSCASPQTAPASTAPPNAPSSAAAQHNRPHSQKSPSFGRRDCGRHKVTNLQVAWQMVAPPLMAEHTDSVVYSRRSAADEVLVYVDDAAFAAELSMNKEIYRLKMQEITGKQLADITFLVSRTTALRKHHQRRH